MVDPTAAWPVAPASYIPARCAAGPLRSPLISRIRVPFSTCPVRCTRGEIPGQCWSRGCV